ncbi:uncharacterized oxidoreductase YjmC-like [Haliotis rubra]|uniref:uncharacterized oxidoreductase YjmC-like n=1 Tax=Haliotis rubra TaxID=36100 RepID=UPI001EE5D46E|nr:uncharacterized oxidoreductase YjmC-like [Haliotis rubra]
MEYVVRRHDLLDFCKRCMVKVGAPVDHAVSLAEVVADADSRGHYSHGLNRLRFYIKSYQFLNQKEHQEPIVVKESVATALVDGNNMLGPVVGRFCMNLAMRKARSTGVGMVSAYRSNHFGIAAHYSMMAMKEGLIGIALCNATPTVVPTRAKQGVFGTNPISVAAPANNADSFVLDMATSTVAFGKVEIKHRLGEPIPEGWAVDDNGQSTTDADTALTSRKLTPLGGHGTDQWLQRLRLAMILKLKINYIAFVYLCGYKGYGLAMMVEMFSSVLSGSNSSPDVRHPSPQQETNLGQCFLAIDPGAFAPGFEDRMSQMIDHCRGLQPAEGETEVLVAGDPERNHTAMCDKRGGIPYQESQIHYADDIAKEYGVDPMKRNQGSTEHDKTS